MMRISRPVVVVPRESHGPYHQSDIAIVVFSKERLWYCRLHDCKRVRHPMMAGCTIVKGRARWDGEYLSVPAAGSMGSRRGMATD